MPRARQLPDRKTLEKWHASRMTFKAMAEKFNAEHPEFDDVTDRAFMNACRRYGFPTRNLKHDELIPWTLRPDHTKLYDTEMIRRFSARMQGKQFDAEMDQKINAWFQNLNDAKSILVYRKDTQQGWVPVKRKPTDDPKLPVRLPPKRK